MFIYFCKIFITIRIYHYVVRNSFNKKCFYLQETTDTQQQEHDHEETNSVVDVTPSPSIETPRRIQTMSKKRKQDQRLTAVTNAIDTLKELKSTTVQIEDEFDFFGRNVASQLRQLPLVNSLRLQTKIQGLLAEERISVLQQTTLDGTLWESPVTSPIPSSATSYDYERSHPSRASTSNYCSNGDMLSEAIRSISYPSEESDVDILNLN